MDNKLTIKMVKGLEKEYRDIIECSQIEYVSLDKKDPNVASLGGEIESINLSFWNIIGRPKIGNIILSVDDFIDSGRFFGLLLHLDSIRKLITK